MDSFSELIKNAIAEVDNFDSAMRKVAMIMARESVKSLLGDRGNLYLAKSD